MVQAEVPGRGQGIQAPDMTVRELPPNRPSDADELKNIMSELCQETDEGTQPWHSFLLPSHLNLHEVPNITLRE